MAISITKGKNTLLLTIVKELDREDVYSLHSELGKWLDESLPKFKGISEEKIKEAWTDNKPIEYNPILQSAPSGFHNKEHYEAYLQAQSKRLLEESMKEYIASIKSTQHIEKELKTIELDPINREVEVTKTKLKENGKTKKRI